jgi:hypothetical protein
LKTPSENPVGKHGFRRKEYIIFINCIAHVVSLKILRKKLSSRNSNRKKNTTFNLLGHSFYRNTTYFLAIANQRSRNKRVEVLESLDGLVEDQKGMLDIAVNFYKDLFRREDRPPISLEHDFWGGSKT